MPLRDALYPPDHEAVAWNIAVLLGGGITLLILNLAYQWFPPPSYMIIADVFVLPCVVPMLYSIYVADKLSNKIVPPIYSIAVAGVFLFLTSSPYVDTVRLTILGSGLLFGMYLDGLFTISILGLKTKPENIILYSYKVNATLERVKEHLLKPEYRMNLYLDTDLLESTKNRVRLGGSDRVYRTTILEIHSGEDEPTCYLSLAFYKPHLWEIVKTPEIEQFGKRQAPYLVGCLLESTPPIKAVQLKGKELEEHSSDLLDFILNEHIIGHAERLQRMPSVSWIKFTVMAALILGTAYFTAVAIDEAERTAAFYTCITLIGIGILELRKPILRRRTK